jgi:hypothetical protein
MIFSNYALCSLNTCRKTLPGERRHDPPQALEILNGSNYLQFKWLRRSASTPPQKPGFALHFSQPLKTISELIKINPGLKKATLHLGETVHCAVLENGTMLRAGIFFLSRFLLTISAKHI